MHEVKTPVYHCISEKLWVDRPLEPDTTIPMYAMAPTNPGEPEGFRFWDFKYDEGFSVMVNGARLSISFPHCHPHFEIFWIRAGSGVLARDCEEIEVRPGMLLVIGPGDIHYWRSTKNLEGSCLSVSELFTSAFNFSLPFDELAAYLKPLGTRTVELNESEDAYVRSSFSLMEGTAASPNFCQVDVIKAFLLILFGKIRGFYASSTAAHAELPTALLTRRFRKALVTDFPRLIFVKEFAQLLGVSRSYLHRTVLRDTGRTPSDHICERMIFESKRLLLHTTNSPAQIASHLGFTSAAYFTNFFRRHAEVGPREFRSRSAA
jgi:AraC family transcriptional activator of pobA